ncbi:MAG: hypothetical protein ABII25_05170 [bacterium]
MCLPVFFIYVNLKFVDIEEKESLVARWVAGVPAKALEERFLPSVEMTKLYDRNDKIRTTPCLPAGRNCCHSERSEESYTQYDIEGIKKYEKNICCFIHVYTNRFDIG